MTRNATTTKKLGILTLPEMHAIGDNVMAHLTDMGDERFDRIPMKYHVFANGEVMPEILESVRFKHVYVLASPTLDCNNRFMQLYLTLGALRAASVKSVTVVAPNLGYSRQDRSNEKRTPVSALEIANLLTMNKCVERVITMDPHCAQIAGFYNAELDDLHAEPLFRAYIKEHWGTELDKLLIVSPDVGGLKRARNFARKLGPEVQVASMDKDRPAHNRAEVLNIFHSGELAGKKAVIMDDIIDTGGSIVAAVKALQERGVEVIAVMATHGLFSPHDGTRAEDRFRTAGIKVVTTNTVPREANYYHANQDWLTMIPIDHFLAQTIHVFSTDGMKFSDLNQ
jgi:ribose-phosphate pyrophosphokinase